MAPALQKPQSIRLPADRQGFSAEAWDQYGTSIWASSGVSWRDVQPAGLMGATRSRKPQPLAGTVKDLSHSFEERISLRHWDLQIALSRFAMYMSANELMRFHIHLDRLVNAEAWPLDEELPDPASFVAFLRWRLHSPWREWSALGFTPSGRLLVSWHAAGEQVTAEFFADERIRFTVLAKGTGGQIINAGSAHLRDFPHAIVGMLSAAWETR